MISGLKQTGCRSLLSFFLLLGCSSPVEIPCRGNAPAAPFTLHFDAKQHPALQKETIRAVSLTGNFNCWTPGLWYLVHLDNGRYAIKLRLTNGTYYYKYQVETESGKFLTLHDPSWVRIYDDGSIPGNRKTRSCLIYRRSGWHLTNGRRSPLSGGSSPRFSFAHGGGKTVFDR